MCFCANVGLRFPDLQGFFPDFQGFCPDFQGFCLDFQQIKNCWGCACTSNSYTSVGIILLIFYLSESFFCLFEVGFIFLVYLRISLVTR